jgi:hypothetical protein
LFSVKTISFEKANCVDIHTHMYGQCYIHRTILVKSQKQINKSCLIYFCYYHYKYHLLIEKTNDISKINKQNSEGMTKEWFLVFIYAVIQRINGTSTKINITWKFNKQSSRSILQQGAKYGNVNTESLIIYNVDPGDDGSYYCRAGPD